MAGGPLLMGPTAQQWQTVALTRTKLLTLATEDWFDEMEEHFALARSALVALALERERLLNKLSILTKGSVLQ